MLAACLEGQEAVQVACDENDTVLPTKQKAFLGKLEKQLNLSSKSHARTPTLAHAHPPNCKSCPYVKNLITR